MKLFFAASLAIAILLTGAGRAGAAEIQPGAENADVLFEAGAPKDAAAAALTTATQSALAAELDTLGEELCFLSLTNFRPGASQEGAPGQAAWTANRARSPELNKALTEFAAEVELSEDDKVVRIINEAVVAPNATVGETVRLSESFKDIKEALNDRSSGPIGDADVDELIGLVSGYLGPIRVRHTSNNFGPQDYCFKAVFETMDRKFRLNIIRRDGKYVWFVEDVI